MNAVADTAVTATTTSSSAPPLHPGLAALLRIWWIASERDTGQAGVLARFLLGLYNGPRFPFDLTDLRRLDESLLQDCLQVLVLDSQPQVEVHVHLARLTGLKNMGARFEILACDLGLANRCSPECEAMLRSGLAAKRVPS